MNDRPDAAVPESMAARNKRALRSDLRKQRHALTAAQRILAAEAIVTHLQTLPAFSTPGYVAGYWATGGELPLHVLQLRLRGDQVWCLPCIQADGSLKFAPWRSGDPLFSNQFGIPEPDVAPSSQLDAREMHAILTPLLGFTRRGQRLGMGGGYYDRALAFRRDAVAPPTLIGVGYAFQEIADFESEAWDVALDAVVTEAGLVDCGSAGR